MAIVNSATKNIRNVRLLVNTCMVFFVVVGIYLGVGLLYYAGKGLFFNN